MSGSTQVGEVLIGMDVLSVRESPSINYGVNMLVSGSNAHGACEVEMDVCE